MASKGALPGRRVPQYYCHSPRLNFFICQDGNAAKSSQKLRHPGTQPRQTHTSQDRGSSDVGDARLPKAVGQQRPRKVGPGPRQSKSQMPPISARVPTAPLQLRWFPGNQVLDGA